MRTSNQRKVVPVRLNDDEIRHCEEQGNGNRSEYIRRLVQQDMAGGDILADKIRAILAEMNVVSLPVLSNEAPVLEVPSVNKPKIKHPSKPVSRNLKTQESEVTTDHLDNQVRSSIKGMLWKAD